MTIMSANVLALSGRSSGVSDAGHAATHARRLVMAAATIDPADELREGTPGRGGDRLVRTTDSKFPARAPSGRRPDCVAAEIGADHDTVLSRWRAS